LVGVQTPDDMTDEKIWRVHATSKSQKAAFSFRELCPSPLTRDGLGMFSMFG